MNKLIEGLEAFNTASDADANEMLGETIKWCAKQTKMSNNFGILIALLGITCDLEKQVTPPTIKEVLIVARMIEIAHKFQAHESLNNKDAKGN